MWERYRNFRWTALTFRNLIVDFGGAFHCFEMILVHSLDIVLGNKEKVVPRFYH